MHCTLAVMHAPPHKRRFHLECVDVHLERMWMIVDVAPALLVRTVTPLMPVNVLRVLLEPTPVQVLHLVRSVMELTSTLSLELHHAPHVVVA